MLYPEIVNDYLIANVSLSNSTAFIIISAYNSIGNDTTNPISINNVIRDDLTVDIHVMTSSYYNELTPILMTSPGISPSNGNVAPISDTVIIAISVPVSLLIVCALILGIIMITLVLLKKRLHHNKDSPSNKVGEIRTNRIITQKVHM
jgi:hypothetical protein